MKECDQKVLMTYFLNWGLVLLESLIVFKSTEYADNEDKTPLEIGSLTSLPKGVKLFQHAFFNFVYAK